MFLDFSGAHAIMKKHTGQAEGAGVQECLLVYGKELHMLRQELDALKSKIDNPPCLAELAYARDLKSL